MIHREDKAVLWLTAAITKPALRRACSCTSTPHSLEARPLQNLMSSSQGVEWKPGACLFNCLVPSTTAAPETRHRYAVRRSLEGVVIRTRNRHAWTYRQAKYVHCRCWSQRKYARLSRLYYTPPLLGHRHDYPSPPSQRP